MKKRKKKKSGGRKKRRKIIPLDSHPRSATGLQ
jgi:hypothetical protein